MAIAYDRMGRYDLAGRFFAQAVAAAPQDARFARNASRFEEAMLARGEIAADTQLAQTQPVEAIMPTETQLARAATAIEANLAPMPGGRMQRVSASEVHIASREDWVGRTTDAGSARVAVMHVGPAKVAESQLAENRRTHIQRVDLAEVRVVEGRMVDGRWTPTENARFVESDGSVRIRVSGSGTHRPQNRQPYPVVVSLNQPG